MSLFIFNGCAHIKKGPRKNCSLFTLEAEIILAHILKFVIVDVRFTDEAYLWAFIFFSG